MQSRKMVELMKEIIKQNEKLDKMNEQLKSVLEVLEKDNKKSE